MMSLEKPKLRRDLIGVCSVGYVCIYVDLISQIPEGSLWEYITLRGDPGRK